MFLKTKSFLKIKLSITQKQITLGAIAFSLSLMIFLTGVTSSPIENKNQQQPKVTVVTKEVETTATAANVKEEEIPIVVEEETETLFYYTLTQEDIETLARLIFLEGRGESFECQCNILTVVLNRVESGYWGGTIDGVVYAARQFSPAYLIGSTTPTSTQYEVINYVLTNGPTLPSYILYFSAGGNQSGVIPYVQVDNTYFGYYLKDYNKFIGN